MVIGCSKCSFKGFIAVVRRKIICSRLARIIVLFCLFGHSIHFSLGFDQIISPIVTVTITITNANTNSIIVIIATTSVVVDYVKLSYYFAVRN